jgi:YEATS domain-containing protein 4
MIVFLFVSVEEKKEKTLQNILNAKNKIRYEINDLKERVKLAKETIVKFKAEITKLQTISPVSGNVS